MAYTQQDLAAIDAAIASGELRVTHNGRSVEYRSIDELLKARATISGELAQQQAGRAGAVSRFTFTTLRD